MRVLSLCSGYGGLELALSQAFPGRSPEDWDSWRAGQRARHGNGNGHGQSLYQALGCPDPAEAVRAVEQMMLLPDGWVTGNGLTVSAERRLLGNGVVPAQGALGIWRAVNRPE